MKNIILLFLLSVFNAASAQKTFSIWPASAPGSENWTWQEQTDTTEISGDPLVYNIAQPTLSFYPADPVVATGTSVIICPGGGFCYLHIKTEGTEVAKWLNKKGVSAFILKYRVVHSETSLPVKERMQKAKDTAVSRKMAAAVAALAIEDAKQAMLYVRRHANEFGIAVNKIGLMGFSAGGTLVAANSFSYTNETRPDFIVPVYAYVSPVLLKNALSDAPPAFIVAATDDDYHLVPMSIDLYNRWLAAGRSAEIHIYSKGGHGFGMNKLNQPSDTRIERLGDWLEIQGLLKK